MGRSSVCEKRSASFRNLCTFRAYIFFFGCRLFARVTSIYWTPELYDRHLTVQQRNILERQKSFEGGGTTQTRQQEFPSGYHETHTWKKRMVKNSKGTRRSQGKSHLPRQKVATMTRKNAAKRSSQENAKQPREREMQR